MRLTEFLLARIAEDDEIARECVRLGVDVGDLSGWVEISGKGTDATEALFSRFSPARVLAECDAKRQIVALHEWAEAASDKPWVHTNEVSGQWEAALETLDLLALPYADHPDYDEAWRP